MLCDPFSVCPWKDWTIYIFIEKPLNSWQRGDEVLRGAIQWLESFAAEFKGFMMNNLFKREYTVIQIVLEFYVWTIKY